MAVKSESIDGIQGSRWVQVWAATPGYANVAVRPFKINEEARMSARNIVLRISTVLAFMVFATIASAQSPSYGPDITLDAAKKMAQAAVVEAKNNKWNVAIAIVDNHGVLVYYERLDDTQTASPNIAVEKARTAAMFRRPSRVFEKAIADGRVAVLGLPGATPIAGGLPITSGGRVIGGIGVSGVTADQDEQIAKAGVDALK